VADIYLLQKFISLGPEETIEAPEDAT
jgi:hypothetical protein